MPVTVRRPVCEICPTSSARKVCKDGFVKQGAKRDSSASSEAGTCRSIGGDPVGAAGSGGNPSAAAIVDAHRFGEAADVPLPEARSGGSNGRCDHAPDSNPTDRLTPRKVPKSSMYGCSLLHRVA